MTCRGGKEASERSEIGEDERQLVMARLAAWWRCSNLVILVMLKKGNYQGEAYVRRGRRKGLFRRERDSLECGRLLNNITIFESALFHSLDPQAIT